MDIKKKELIESGFNNIENALRHIATVRRSLMDTCLSKEEIDRFIAEKGEELFKEYEEMSEHQLVQSMLAEVLADILNTFEKEKEK